MDMEKASKHCIMKHNGWLPSVVGDYTRFNILVSRCHTISTATLNSEF